MGDIFESEEENTLKNIEYSAFMPTKQAALTGQAAFLKSIIEHNPKYLKKPPKSLNTLAGFLNVSNALIYKWYNNKAQIPAKRLANILQRVLPLYNPRYENISFNLYSIAEFEYEYSGYYSDEPTSLKGSKYIKDFWKELISSIDYYDSEILLTVYTGLFTFPASMTENYRYLIVNGPDGLSDFTLDNEKTKESDIAFYEIYRHIQVHPDKFDEHFSSLDKINEYFDLPKVDHFPYFFKYFLDGLESK